MTPVSAPCVMVSSTYYDLRQVRADLESFLGNELGYIPLLSEFPSFPVDPDRKTVENCRVRVRDHADVLILVVGGRHGFVDPSSGKSVTNLEYLAAKTKGIPVYAFIERTVLSNLPVWRANPGADFSSVVEDSRVFAFVETVRSEDGVWCFEFDGAEAIIRALRLQFAHQMKQGLESFARMRRTADRDMLDGMSPDAYAIALEKPDGWEYLLFAQSVADELARASELKRRYIERVALGRGERVSISELSSWSEPKTGELLRIFRAFEIAINDRFPEAIGAPGEAGSVAAIVRTAQLIGDGYRAALEWSASVRCAVGHERLRPVLDAMALFPDDLLSKVETFGEPLLVRFQEALLDAGHEGGVKVEANATPVLSHLEEFQEALEDLQRDLEHGVLDGD